MDDRLDHRCSWTSYAITVVNSICSRPFRHPIHLASKQIPSCLAWGICSVVHTTTWYIVILSVWEIYFLKFIKSWFKDSQLCHGVLSVQAPLGLHDFHSCPVHIAFHQVAIRIASAPPIMTTNYISSRSINRNCNSLLRHRFRFERFSGTLEWGPAVELQDHVNHHINSYAKYVKWARRGRIQ